MRKARPALAFVIACALALPTICGATDNSFANLTRAHSEIKWDKSSLVTADFNGDKIKDSAALGYKEDQIVIGISMGHTSNGKP